MALTDLLWACPVCGRDRGLQADGRRAFACDGCHTTFRRDRDARIRATRADGSTEVASAAAWVDRLPALDSLMPRPEEAAAAAGAGEAGATVRTARVRSRQATKTDVVRGDSGYLNRIEIFDRDAPGRLELTTDALVYRPGAAGSEGPDGSHGSDPAVGPDAGENVEAARTWGLGQLTAVQASSRTLQIKVRDRPLVSFRFEDDSVFLWELLLQEVLRRYYRRAGRGEIAEFQPRIVTEEGT